MQQGFKIDPKDHERLMLYMRQTYGINLQHKQSLIEGRLGMLIQRRGFKDFHEYVNYALSDATGSEATMLVSRLTTNYTYFMREDQHYRYMQGVILPELSAAVRDKDLRIWSAGCSSGEESYTIAMVLADFFGGIVTPWEKTVLATDISEKVLTTAREGIYTRESLERVPEYWKKAYFKKIDAETVQVVDDLRRQVQFARFNLMETRVPFRRKFHVIFCRNVMIYFDAPTKEALIQRFYDHIEPGGHLIVGMSENLQGKGTPFRQVQPSIYRKERA